MAESNSLWHAATRKETMDILVLLWPALDGAGRERLAAELLAGPPESMLDHIDVAERHTSRARRIYDRIIVLERLGQPPLTPALAERMQILRQAYPEWRAAPGERAHFGSWIEMRWGPDTKYSVDDLAAMDDEALLHRLRHDVEYREGLLDSWRQLAIAQPKRSFSLLERLCRSNNIGPVDIWEHGLWGLRDAENAGATITEMLTLLPDVPDALFNNPDFVRSVADLLETKSRTEAGHGESAFWHVWNRALAASSAQAVEEDDSVKVNRDWTHEAINSPLGRLATAFVNVLFSRHLKVSEGVPEDLRRPIDQLMAPVKPHHRLARVIGASRVAYLNAIDPEWTASTLIPAFNWANEEESIAMWQGYAWQARIDPQLWAALKPYFLPLFQPNRLARMGSWGRNIAQMLMLVGIAFGFDEFKRDEVRNAIRAMPEGMRVDAASWLAGYMETEDPSADGDEAIEATPDARWRDRVEPWLKRVWPTEAASRSPQVSEQFALAVIATEDAFPDAVAAIEPYLVPDDAYPVLVALDASDHPDQHAEATLLLLDATVVQDRQRLFGGQLRSVIRRIGLSNPALHDDNRYRRWAEYIAKREVN